MSPKPGGPNPVDPSLSTALDELALAAADGGLDAAALEGVIERHPHHADDLTDFAVEWSLASGPEDGGADDGAEESTGDARVARAMDRFRASLDAGPADPFEGRSPQQLRDLGAELGLDVTLVAKLRDRRLDVATVPGTLCRDLSKALGVETAVLHAHLAATPTIHGAARFKAPSKPAAEGREPFPLAVRRSTLDDVSKARLLALGDGIR
ncbi:MAG: hypothetical protein AAGD06_22580 [Acidobacteriota bacterium]